MKRLSEESSLATKEKTQFSCPSGGPSDTDPSVFDEARRRTAREVYEGSALADDTGFILFTIRVKWDDATPGEVRLRAVSEEGGGTVSFDVYFRGQCVRYFRAAGLQFEIHDEVYLSMKGAAVDRQKSPQYDAEALPMALIYSDGVRLKLSKKKQPLLDGLIFDSWEYVSRKPRVTTGDAPLQDDWFSTPVIALQQGAEQQQAFFAGEKQEGGVQEQDDLSRNVVAAAYSKVPKQDSIPPSFLPRGSAESSASDSRAGSPTAFSPDRPQQRLYRDTGPKYGKAKSRSAACSRTPPSHATSGYVRLTAAFADQKTEEHQDDATSNALAAKKGRKKAMRVARKAAMGDADEPAESAMQIAATTEPVDQEKQGLIPVVAMTPPSESPIRATADPPPTPTAQPRANGANEVPSILTKPEGGTWCPLGDLTVCKGDCIIGVVVYAGNVGTSAKAECYRRMSLSDPTVADKDNQQAGLTVTCFGKRQNTLPNPEKGDVIIIRDVAIENLHGVKLIGSCPSFKLWSWTIFHPESGTFRSGGTALSPDSPTSNASSAEKQYCIKLADWWLELSKELAVDEGAATVHQIDAGGGHSSSAGGRVFRLIQDATPHAPPSGFFDCIIEVLSGHQNDNGVYSLYVTDYTRNASIPPVSAAWCSPAMSDLVFKIELWKEAAFKGSEMKAGEYFEMKNVRIKESSGGFWEGSFSEVKKLRQLDEDDLDDEPHLVDLLKRKKVWQEEAELNGTKRFPHKLFKDATTDSHFDCTVEVLRVSEKEDNRSLLYVTDYTPRPDMSHISAIAEWTRGIPHDRILKVGVFDAQAKAAQGLREGDIIAIRTMRLKAVAGGAIAGRIGGEERLVYKLDPRNTGNEHAIALLNRQKQWEAALRKKEEQIAKKASKKQSNLGKRRTGSAEAPRKKPKLERLPGTTSLRELEKVHPEAGPARFLVLARVVDHHPENVADFVSRYCSSCGQDLPEKLRCCAECDLDMDSSDATPYFKFSLELEDDEGTRLQVPVACTKEHGCGFLYDLEPVDFLEEEDALDEFKEKLRPLLGELLTGKRDSAEAPFHHVVLIKTSGHPGFFFWDYTPVNRREQ